METSTIALTNEIAQLREAMRVCLDALQMARGYVLASRQFTPGAGMTTLKMIDDAEKSAIAAL